MDMFGSPLAKSSRSSRLIHQCNYNPEENKEYKNIFVFAEQREGQIQPVAYELIGKARDLAGVSGEKVVAMLLGQGVSDKAQQLIAMGADEVLVADCPELKEYLTEHCGIGADRIFTDELAMTTTDNAVNSLAILQEQQIDTMTVVTSDYHQLWGQTLFHAQAEKNRLAGGRPVRIVANYNWPAGSDRYGGGLLYTVFQLDEILSRP